MNAGQGSQLCRTKRWQHSATCAVCRSIGKLHCHQRWVSIPHAHAAATTNCSSPAQLLQPLPPATNCCGWPPAPRPPAVTTRRLLHLLPLNSILLLLQLQLAAKLLPLLLATSPPHPQTPHPPGLAGGSAGWRRSPSAGSAAPQRRACQRRRAPRPRLHGRQQGASVCEGGVGAGAGAGRGRGNAGQALARASQDTACAALRAPAVSALTSTAGGSSSSSSSSREQTPAAGRRVGGGGQQARQVAGTHAASTTHLRSLHPPAPRTFSAAAGRLCGTASQ